MRIDQLNRHRPFCMLKIINTRSVPFLHDHTHTNIKRTFSSKICVAFIMQNKCIPSLPNTIIHSSAAASAHSYT